MPANIETVVHNGQLLALTQEMIQERLEEFAQRHRRLRTIHVSVDLDNPDRPAVEITSPIGQQELVGKASADNVVQAVDEATRHLQRALQERKDQIQEQLPVRRDDRRVKIGGGVVAVLLLAILAFNIMPSGERKLFHVSGKVMFDADPVPAGFVLFDPDISAGNDGAQGYAEIKDGIFDTASTGKGTSGGDYVVRVRGFVPPHGDVPGKMLFREYKQTIQLPTDDSLQDIVVPASARSKTDSLPDQT